jgi:hypothetical protein
MNNDIELLINIYKHAAMQGFFHPDLDYEDQTNKKIGSLIRAGMELEEKIKNKRAEE